MHLDVVRVSRVVRSALDKTEPAQQPIPLEEHLSVSQHLQCLLNPATAQKIKLQQNMETQQPNVAALCINHALRLESQYECQHAASQAAAMGLQPDIMQMEWLEKPRQGRLMETASINRYLLLHRACKDKNISVLIMLVSRKAVVRPICQHALLCSKCWFYFILHNGVCGATAPFGLTQGCKELQMESVSIQETKLRT